MKIVIVCLKYELKKSMYYRTQFIFRVKQIINGIGTKLISLERSNAYIYILVSKLTLIDCGNSHYPATFTETSVYSLRTDLREMNFNKIYVHRDTINSRPDMSYPNHLLLLKDQPSLPPGMFSEADNNVRRRWRQIQYLSDLFGKRWVPEYLTVLQDRLKWLFPKRNVQVNDVVLIVDRGAPRGSWLLGRMIETYPDKNGCVRNVAMKTRSSRLVRPVSKLVMVLECDE